MWKGMEADWESGIRMVWIQDNENKTNKTNNKTGRVPSGHGGYNVLVRLLYAGV